MSNAIHVFESFGLGTAPFTLDHVTGEGGNCEFCGTAIVWRFYIKGTDGSTFFVGSDCVMKTGKPQGGKPRLCRPHRGKPR